MTASEPQVLLERDGDIAVITMNRPHRRNAVTIGFLEELDGVVRQVGADAEIRAVVLTGAGVAFSVGADLAVDRESAALRGESIPDDVRRMRGASRVVESLAGLPQPTIAAINGACAGAGVSLAMAADLRIAADTAVVNTAFLNAAMPGDLGAIWFVVTALGSARARELFLQPERLTAQQAELLGLVSGVHPVEELLDVAREQARALARRAPLALRAMKQNLLDATGLPLAAYLDAESERMVRTFHTADTKEAAAAFLERREPRFLGR